jgi:hypothetical protein
MWSLPFPYPAGVEGAGPEAYADPAAFFEQSMAALLAREGLDPARDLCGVIFETFQGWGAWFYPAPGEPAIKR